MSVGSGNRAAVGDLAKTSGNSGKKENRTDQRMNEF